MSETIILQRAVDSFLVGKESVSTDDLRELWWSLFIEGTPGADYGLEKVIDLIQTNTDIAELEFKLGAWKWDVRGNVVNSVLSSVLVGGILESAGYLNLAGYTLPAVLAVLFKMDAVRIEKKDKALVLILQERGGQDGLPRRIDELYQLLPRKERRAIAESDFIAFVERLREVGKVKPDIGGTFRIVADGEEPWIKINVLR